MFFAANLCCEKKVESEYYVLAYMAVNNCEPRSYVNHDVSHPFTLSNK